jgi:xylulose-5-phosphate/fructose-6-phosphate phosphoketolase
MPQQQIAQANPPPDPSLLPDSLLGLGIQLDNKHVLSQFELTAIHKFRRAAYYIAAGTRGTEINA